VSHPRKCQNMKICHLTTVHPWGDTRIYHKMCRSLAAQGHDVTLMARAPMPRFKPMRSLRLLPICERATGSRIRRMWHSLFDVMRVANRISTDIIHFHDAELLLSGYLMRLKGKRVIYDAHEDLPKQILTKHWIPTPLRPSVALCMKTVESLLAGRMSAIVCATSSISHRFSAVSGKVIVVNNFPIQGELGSTTDWQNRPPHACFVGSMTKIRGILQVIEACHLAGVPLHLAGTFGEPGLRKEAEALPGWENVTEHGQIDRQGVKDLMAHCRVGLVTFLPAPNHLDAQPNKLFEYLSAGLPVIASDFPLWRDLIENKRLGIMVQPDDVHAIAQALREIVFNEAPGREASKRAIACAARRYNWSTEFEKLVQLYHSLKPKPSS
jgi:glycosyltransferase involved in cell wall biosynthesis